MARSSARSSRRRLTGSRRTYREPDSETDFEIESPSFNSRPARSSRRIQTYREESTTAEDQSDDDDDKPFFRASPNSAFSQVQTDQVHRRAGQRNNSLRRSRRARKGSTLQGPSSAPALRSFKRRKPNHASRVESKPYKGKEAAEQVTLLPVNTSAPPWQTLEYDILFRIMRYSAFPLYSSTFRSRPSIGWLIGVSRLCKSFFHAATAALLWKPPLFPVYRAHGLLRILALDQDQLAINYRTKIRSLDIEVKHFLVRKSGINIEDLLPHVPQLTNLRIFHGHDEKIGKDVWAEPTVAHFKWSYDRLFECLDNNNIRLKSFEWNGRFQDTLQAMQTTHTLPCLNAIENLSIVNLNFSDKQETERVSTRNNMLSALTMLQNIKTLKFQNCTILDLQAAGQLPIGLQALTIVNCLSLTSEAIKSYLTIGGNSLRTLNLEGNQVMDLSFMPNLSSFCPNLETLHIDLSYEDSSSYHDRNPLYDDLLPEGSPTWPSSLLSIVVGPLRSLDASDAEDFYMSLVNAADHLPYLRVLSVKTILNNASWRDRARLRTKWMPLFEKIFAANKTYVPTIAKPKPEKLSRSQRKSVRLQELEDASVSEEVDDVTVTIPDMPTLPRQNRCEVVEFDLSDQRPAQEQYREDDFLDSEPSGDEEWNGRDQGLTGAAYTR